MGVIWAPHDRAVEGLAPLAVSFCKVLVLDDHEYVHYNTETTDLTSSQDKRFMLLKKTIVSKSVNQHKCLARPQGSEIFSSSCNALPIVTKDDVVTERILWLPIKHGARVSQKDKLGLTYFFIIWLPGWIPGVNAAGENALLQGYTCTWICIIIGTIALVYFAYKIYSQPPPEPYLFSEKVLVLDDLEYVTIDLKLHSHMRAVERAEFDHQVAEKMSLFEQYKMERERLQKLAEEEEIRRLRKELVPKAQPMPYFD